MNDEYASGSWCRSQTFVATRFCSSSANSSARLYWGLRKLPLSNSVRWPFGSTRASCWCEKPRVSFGNENWLFAAWSPIRHTSAPVCPSILVTSFMWRLEMT